MTTLSSLLSSSSFSLCPCALIMYMCMCMCAKRDRKRERRRANREYRRRSEGQANAHTREREQEQKGQDSTRIKRTQKCNAVKRPIIWRFTVGRRWSVGWWWWRRSFFFFSSSITFSRSHTLLFFSLRCIQHLVVQPCYTAYSSCFCKNFSLLFLIFFSTEKKP